MPDEVPEHDLLLETLRVRAGGAIARTLSEKPRGRAGVVELVQRLGPETAQGKPLAVVTIARVQQLAPDASDATAVRVMLTNLFAGALDALAGHPCIWEIDAQELVDAELPGVLDKYDTNTASGQREFESLMNTLSLPPNGTSTEPPLGNQFSVADGFMPGTP